MVGASERAYDVIKLPRPESAETDRDNVLEEPGSKLDKAARR